jgi:hypothetical protein
MSSPLVLYSTYTWIAFQLNELYYAGMHYVWCTPHFDPHSPFLGAVSAVPPTSSPKVIYESLAAEVAAGDRHSAKVGQNRLGLQRGADIQLRRGAISNEQHQEIIEIVEAAETRDFRPLLFVIPYTAVSAMIKQVPIKERAHPLSEEFILESLPRRAFDVWEI